MPHEFNPWILARARIYRRLVELFFEATAATRLESGRNHFGGQIGLTLVLHSWDQQLRPHFHLHGLVPPGQLPPQPGWLRRLQRKPFTIYPHPPFAGPHKLLGYLGRYTHRTAIGNERLLAYDGRRVTFRYRDRADGDRLICATLDAGLLGREHVPSAPPALTLADWLREVAGLDIQRCPRCSHILLWSRCHPDL